MKISMNMEYLIPLCEEVKKHCDKYDNCEECPLHIRLECDKLIEARNNVCASLMFFDSNFGDKDFQSILDSVYTLEKRCYCTGECEKCTDKIKCQNVDEWAVEAHERLTSLLNEFLSEKTP